MGLQQCCRRQLFRWSFFMVFTVLLRAENVRSKVAETRDNAKYNLSSFLWTSPRIVLVTGVLICWASQIWSYICKLTYFEQIKKMKFFTAIFRTKTSGEDWDPKFSFRGTTASGPSPLPPPTSAKSSMLLCQSQRLNELFLLQNKHLLQVLAHSSCLIPIFNYNNCSERLKDHFTGD